MSYWRRSVSIVVPASVVRGQWRVGNRGGCCVRIKVGPLSAGELLSVPGLTPVACLRVPTKIFCHSATAVPVLTLAPTTIAFWPCASNVASLADKPAFFAACMDAVSELTTVETCNDRNKRACARAAARARGITIWPSHIQRCTTSRHRI